MKMEHFVLGFIFNKIKDSVLLIKKKRPKWQAGRWNGIGGKVDPDDDSPLEAMRRETFEETDLSFTFEHCITFVCPGGTVFVYKGIYGGNSITFNQKEDEKLKVWPLNNLPKNIATDLKWIIPVCLSTLQFPVIVHQTTLGDI